MIGLRFGDITISPDRTTCTQRLLYTVDIFCEVLKTVYTFGVAGKYYSPFSLEHQLPVPPKQGTKGYTPAYSRTTNNKLSVARTSVVHWHHVAILDSPYA